MEELYSGYKWVNHFDWELSGKNEHYNINFKQICPEDVLPLIGVILQIQAQKDIENSLVDIDESISTKLCKVIEDAVISIETLQKITDAPKETILEIMRGEQKQYEYSYGLVTLLLLIEKLAD
ncbi:hypothetical protein KPC83_01740 [Collinsella sp. zg1085]|uniref:hypothetical protein n=1 Tax=Collinsella sp. zg1085 TaxID=2844380 RepID=UPI001C0B8B2D|nr:hypothetical protein [Collinsella sp. zg1085]QWT17898.1 hypothetical protein KPC83_01740 [Collinsella sp. zg1085]